MKRFLLCFLFLALCAIGALGQTPLFPSRYTVATLPAASTLPNRVVIVRDGTAVGDCSVGGGVAETWCKSNGSTWIPLGDGTGAGGTLTDVTASSPLHSSGGATPNITIDDADATHKGALSAADWATFNAKQNALGFTPLNAASNLSDLINAGTARGNLGVAIGSNVQAWDPDLDTLAGLTPTTDNFIVSVASAWASRTPAQVKSTLALNLVENTALSTWAGSSNLVTVGTLTSGATGAGFTVALSTSTITGTLADARLSANVPLLNAANAFSSTGQTSFAGNVLLGNTIANLFLKDTSTGFQSAATTIVQLQANNRFQSSGYVSQTTGFAADGATGTGDFRYLYADELHAKAFIVDLEQALAGGQIITKSVSKVASDFAIPSAGASGTLTIEEFAGSTAQVFIVGDLIQVRQTTRSADTSLSIASAWGTITSYISRVAASGTTPAYQNYTFARPASNGGTATGTISAGTLAIDYGTTANKWGYFETNAVDGANAVNSPYSQVVTSSGTGGPAVPSNRTIRSRLGNLNGITGVQEYGLYAGNYVVGDTFGAAHRYLRLTDSNFELNNLDLSIYNSGNKVIAMDYATPYFSIGAVAPTSFLQASSNGIWMGNGGSSVYKMRVGAVNGGGTLTAGFTWDGTTFTVIGGGTFSGALSAPTGNIGGFTIGATSLLAGSGSTTVAMDSGGTNPAFYAGSATPGSAPFRVTNAGALTATNATVTGTVNANAGNFSGVSLIGLLTMSGASSAQAIGLTPPTSASAGTGLWIDRTGFYAVAANKQKLSIDAATGGLTIINDGSAVGILLGSTGDPFTRNDSSPFYLEATSGDGASQSTIKFRERVEPLAHLSQAYWKLATSIDGGAYADLLTLRDTGAFYVLGTISAGSGFTVLTDSAGKILSAALNTVAVANGGTGVTTSTGAGSVMLSDSPTTTGTFTGAAATFSSTFKWGMAGATYMYAGGTSHIFGYSDSTSNVIYSGGSGGLGINNQADDTRLLTIGNTGGVVIGSPTGGDKGAGTVNAQAVYDDNVLLTDWVFDPAHKASTSRRLYDLEETKGYTIAERRLPWMPAPSEFEQARNLGGMTTRLWQGQEQQQLYIFQLEERIKRLEAAQAKGNQ